MELWISCLLNLFFPVTGTGNSQSNHFILKPATSGRVASLSWRGLVPGSSRLLLCLASQGAVLAPLVNHRDVAFCVHGWYGTCSNRLSSCLPKRFQGIIFPGPMACVASASLLGSAEGREWAREAGRFTTQLVWWWGARWGECPRISIARRRPSMGCCPRLVHGPWSRQWLWMQRSWPGFSLAPDWWGERLHDPKAARTLLLAHSTWTPGPPRAGLGWWGITSLPSVGSSEPFSLHFHLLCFQFWSTVGFS